MPTVCTIKRVSSVKKTRRILFSILWLTLTLSAPARIVLSQTSGPDPTAPSADDRSSQTSILQAEALDRIVVDISSQQVVGHPLSGTARLLLLDDSSNFITDYDFAGQPFQLSSGAGSLTPNVIDDSSLFSNGIVSFLPMNVTYDGPSGAVAVTASNGAVISAGTIVSFSGYEILAAVDRLGDPISSVYSGQAVTASVSVTNGGDLTASAEPSLKAYFASGGGSTKIFFPPGSHGSVDTVSIGLPTTGLAEGQDTLVLVLESSYEPEGVPLPVTDTVRVPVSVLPPADFTLVTGSLKPDSVFAGVAFDLSFDVSVGGFAGPIDSTRLAVHLVTETDSILTTVYEGEPDFAAFADSVISYTGLTAAVDSALGLVDGWYDVRLDYRLASGGNLFTLPSGSVDSLLLLPSADLEYVSQSFAPVEVSSDQEAEFEFDISLTGAAPMLLDQEQSEFVISGDDFSTTTNLSVPGDSLIAGDNHFTTGQVFIPAYHLGDTLNVFATIVYYTVGAANRLTFGTDFNGQPVMVEELPTVQITQVSVVAPNSPNVNINQEFRIAFQIANLSTTDQPPFDLQIVSDGSSLFDSEMTIPGVPGESVIDSFFTIQASSTANPSEIFRIDIASLGVNELPPVDNIAQAMIQEPAILSVSVILRGGSEGYVRVNDDFDLILTVVNSGEAEALGGEITVTTNGLDLGVPDPLTLTVEVGQPAGVQFLAPSFDTSLTIDIELTEIPVDVNTGLPAIIGETEFEINLAVLSEDLQLIISSEPVSPNVLLPGKRRELLRLALENEGTSSVTSIRLQTMSFSVSDKDGEPLNARSVMEVGSTGLFDGPHEVTSATAGGDRLHLTFQDYIINGTGPVELAFRTRILAEVNQTFGLALNVEDIKAVYASGPIEGQPVEISHAGYGDSVFNDQFTTVAADLAGSFIIRDNPFNPNEGPAEFQYVRAETGKIIFRILTLTGEVVLEEVQPEVSPGESRTISWDGRNEEGEMVLNGVYLAVLTNDRTGAQATIKVAVLK